MFASRKNYFSSFCCMTLLIDFKCNSNKITSFNTSIYLLLVFINWYALDYSLYPKNIHLIKCASNLYSFLWIKTWTLQPNILKWDKLGWCPNHIWYVIIWFWFNLMGFQLQVIYSHQNFPRKRFLIVLHMNSC
jgi:hypothetical protein